MTSAVMYSGSSSSLRPEQRPSGTATSPRYGEKCSCCPYGYHIDLDFLRYLDSMYNGDSLRNLRRIKHSRSAGLNQSCEGFFSDDELSRWRTLSLSPVHSPPPRSVSSASHVTTDDIVMEIDSSMSHTLNSIDEVDSRVVRKKKPPVKTPVERRLEINGGSLEHRQQAPIVESVERQDRRQLESMQQQQQQQQQLHSSVTEIKTTTVTTSTEFADRFSGLMSEVPAPSHRQQQQQQAVAGPVTSPVAGPGPVAASEEPATISPAALQAIREQMAASLQRMRELEDQVRVMSSMESEITSLREENRRLYNLLAKLTDGDKSKVSEISELRIEREESIRTFRDEFGTVVVELPVRIGKVDLRSIGVGDSDVFDCSDHGTVSYSSHSHDLSNEVHSEVNAMSRRAFLWSNMEAGSDTGLVLGRLSPGARPSHSVGIGDGNVLEQGVCPGWRRDTGSGEQTMEGGVCPGWRRDTGSGEHTMEGGTRIDLTVTASGEKRRMLEQRRWEVERFGTGKFQDVAVQCMIIGGFLSHDRLQQSQEWSKYLTDEQCSNEQNVETLITNKPAVSSFCPQLLADRVNIVSDSDIVVESAIAPIQVQKESSSWEDKLFKLCQVKPPESSEMEVGMVEETCVVPERATPRVVDWNKLVELEEKKVTEEIIKEETIVPVAAEKRKVDVDLEQLDSQQLVNTGRSQESLDLQSSSPVNTTQDTLYSAVDSSDTADNTQTMNVVSEEMIVAVAAEPRHVALDNSFLVQVAVDEGTSNMVDEDFEDLVVAQSNTSCLAECTVEEEERLVSEELIVPVSAKPRHLEMNESCSGSLLIETTQQTFQDRTVSGTEAEAEAFPPHLSPIKALSFSDIDDVVVDSAVTTTSIDTDVRQIERSDEASETGYVTTSDDQCSTAVKVDGTTDTSRVTTSDDQCSTAVRVDGTTDTSRVTISDDQCSTMVREDSSTDVTLLNATQLNTNLSETYLEIPQFTPAEDKTTDIETEQVSTSVEQPDDVTVTIVTPSTTDVVTSESAVAMTTSSEHLVSSECESVEVLDNSLSTVARDEIIDASKYTLPPPQLQVLQQQTSEHTTTTTTTTTSTTDDDSVSGCRVVITETRIERQLIGPVLDKSADASTVTDQSQADTTTGVDQSETVYISTAGNTDDKVDVERLSTEGATDLTSQQNTFTFEQSEVNEETLRAAAVYAQWLIDSTKVSAEHKAACIELIQKDWFHVAGRKSSNALEVRNYLSAFERIHLPLLFAVVNMADVDGNTALHYAVSHCNIGVIEALLDSGVCDVRRQNRAGYTSIMLASLLIVDTESHSDVIKRLFTVGDVNVKSATSGQTALMLAASHGRCDMVRLLLESGADVNCRDEDGSTALMCACEHGYSDIVELLLNHPTCDSTLTDVDGSTALSIAMDEGHRDIGVLLYAHMNAGRHTSSTDVPDEETL